MADVLGVSVRSAYRDIETLRGLVADIDGEAGVGFQLRQGFFLPPLALNDDELEAMLLGLRRIASSDSGGLAVVRCYNDNIIKKIEVMDIVNTTVSDDDGVDKQQLEQSASFDKADDKGATLEGIRQVVTANNRFAISLYQKMNCEVDDSNKNIFFSPYSLSTAMAMFFAAAEGETKQQIQQTFCYPMLDILNPNSAALYNRFNQPNANYQLNITNDLWLRRGLTANAKYIDTVQRYYGSDVTNLDFAISPELSRQVINQKIARQTHGMVTKLLPLYSIDINTICILTSSIHFKGNWQKPFAVKDTADKPFYLFDGAVKQVKMMQLVDSFLYTEDKRTQVMQLPYQGDELAMLLVLPKSNSKAGIQSLMNRLTTEKISQWIDTLHKQEVVLVLPKFKLEKKYEMSSLLADLGMPLAFSDHANFVLFNSKLFFKISEVYHQAAVEVDEQGTEAAAATAITDWMDSSFRQPVAFIANHPFLFIIMDKKTNAILFLGQVNNL